MAVRLTKIVLVAALALQMSLIVFNNITDYDANYEFVKHVLLMDTTQKSEQTTWRAIPVDSAWRFSYLCLILWEALVAVLLWTGAYRCYTAREADSDDFARSKSLAIAGLTVGLLLWLVAFNTMGGEWFLMGQSQTWNGLEGALRHFVTMGIVLIFFCQSEASFRVQRRSKRRRSSRNRTTSEDVLDSPTSAPTVGD